MMINVTKTYLPNRQKYISYIDKIYKSGRVTNDGPLVQELEIRLSEYLRVKNIILVANGTIALEIAYRLLELKGEVITTPFSFVATTSSLVTNGLKPVFADIDPMSFNLHPNNIEKGISNETSAIVPVHIFGNACDVEDIEKIASENNLKIIYDAAHAFAVSYQDGSLLDYGDISTLSFHATKIFHTIEGGALIVNDESLTEKARLLINFGIDGVDSVKGLGTNGKMTEFEAAMGLCILDDIEHLLDLRREVHDRYENGLSDVVMLQKKNENSTQNYTYFPVVFESEEQMLKVKKALNDREIYPRRYFYPSLDTLPYMKGEDAMHISRSISGRIMSLPMYHDLSKIQQNKIISIIKNNL